MVRAGKTAIYPLQILINYWESKPSRLPVKLKLLLRQGVTHVASYVPWQAAEADISHSLTKFLHAILDQKMSVTLILSPEVAVDYPYCGLPKEFGEKVEAGARSREGKAYRQTLPPRFFRLPSLAASDLQKRYFQLLAKVDAVLGDLHRERPNALNHIQVILSGSFHKYYRTPATAALSTFKGINGDFSELAQAQFKEHVDTLALDPEFHSKAWKKPELEALHLQNFFQLQEENFRLRSSQQLRKKAFNLDVVHTELFTPEADPSTQYSQVLQFIGDEMQDFSTLNRLIIEALSRNSVVGEARSYPLIRWTGLGGFRVLSDSEKQFLILKSLMLLGGAGGGILIDEREWYALSQAFRNRVEMLAEALLQDELELPSQVLCLVPHLWSDGRRDTTSPLLWPQVRQVAEFGCRLVASVEALSWWPEAKAVFVENSVILTRVKMERLLAAAESGRVVILPRDIFMTDDARVEINQSLKLLRPLDVSLGAKYQVYHHGTGKVVLVENYGEMQDQLRFVLAMMNLGGIEREVLSKDPRLDLVLLHRGGGKAGLFVFNSLREPLLTEIDFPYEVSIGDLASILSRSAEKPSSKAVNASEDGIPDEMPGNEMSQRFSLEVPPCGVLPVAVTGMGEEAKERREAAMSQGLTQRHAMDAARGELTGFSEHSDIFGGFSAPEPSRPVQKGPKK